MEHNSNYDQNQPQDLDFNGEMDLDIEAMNELFPGWDEECDSEV